MHFHCILSIVWLWTGVVATQDPCRNRSKTWNISSNNNSILIGFISSFDYGYGKLIAGAMSLAVADVNSRSDLLPNHVLEFVAADSGDLNSAQAIRKMTEMRDKGVIAFIGPDHNCLCEALTAAAWNLPMLAFKCSDPRLSEKAIYSTFARTIPTGWKVSKSVMALLLHYEWRKIILIVTEDPSNLQTEEALVILAGKYNVTITKRYHLPCDYRSGSKSNITKIINESYDKNRIYVLLTDDHFLVDFVRCMNSSELLDSGEYAIVLVEEEQVRNKDFLFIREFEVFKKDKLESNFSSYRAALIITPRFSRTTHEFQDKVLNYSSQPPFCIKYHPEIRVTVPANAGFLYDAVVLYARVATEVLKQGKSLRNGTEIIQHIYSAKYESVLGFNATMDSDGNIESEYEVLSLKQPGGEYKMQSVGRFHYQPGQKQGNLPSLDLEDKIDWIGGKPPLSEPECGFKNDCGPDWVLILLCSTCIPVIITVAAFGYRHYRYERKLACLLWKIDSKDLVLMTPTAWQAVIDYNKDEDAIAASEEEELVPPKENSHQVLGFYKGNTVYIKPIRKKNINITRSLRKEIMQIREMRHENINSFIGACVDPSHICIVSFFCVRGSLKDILKNKEIKLNNMLISSLIADLIKGMTYIHEREIVAHGNLTSSNCLVDSRWALKLTDFGLHEFKEGRRLTLKEKKRRTKNLLWRAPELLRAIDPPERGTQKGDVYSFTIILHEVLGRQGPWGPRTLPHKTIVERVTMGPAMNDSQPFRPPLLPEVTSRWPDSVIRCLQECWREDPARRPDFRSINVKLREMFSELKPNIFDNMLSIMEEYASDLESLVQERTHLLMEEKKKTENLLLRMLPKPVAEQLKRGESVDAESFDSVTIYFSDIIGFTAISAISTPLQVVDLLNDLYTCFDKIIGDYDVYKVETIGDAYMVVSGLPIRNGDSHAWQIAAMALRLLDAIGRFKIRHRPTETLKLRVGIHSGPCVAGVVGMKMPRYCLFGDTVNTAARMESTGEALKIHLSSACKEILDIFGDFDLKERGVIQIKGKGEMRTYWLMGRSAKSSSLSDDAKLRRHTDSRLEVHFSPRLYPSSRNSRTSSKARSWQWSSAVESDQNTTVSASSCRDLEVKRTPKSYRWLPTIGFTDSRLGQLRRNAM